MSSEKSKKSGKNNTGKLCILTVALCMGLYTIHLLILGSANQEFLDEIKSSSCFDLLSSREVQVI